jgi:hypothetical protein
MADVAASLGKVHSMLTVVAEDGARRVLAAAVTKGPGSRPAGLHSASNWQMNHERPFCTYTP